MQKFQDFVLSPLCVIIALIHFLFTIFLYFSELTPISVFCLFNGLFFTDLQIIHVYTGSKYPSALHDALLSLYALHPGIPGFEFPRILLKKLTSKRCFWLGYLKMCFDTFLILLLHFFNSCFAHFWECPYISL